MLNSIKNIFKIGLKTKTIDEQTIEVEYLGKKQNVLLAVPYGTFVKLPDEDITTLIWPESGNEDVLIGLATDIENRDDDLEKLEVSYGIPTLKDRIKFSKDEKIIFIIGDTSGGDFAVRYNELETAFNELKDDFNNFVRDVHNSDVVPHTHTFNYNAGPTPSSGTTATAVIGTGMETSADITPAKIEEIELPEV